jgi:hypothetical protein
MSAMSKSRPSWAICGLTPRSEGELAARQECELITNRQKELSKDAHVGRPTLTPVSFVMVSREPAIVRKSLEINKDGVFGRDSRLTARIRLTSHLRIR